MGVDVVALLRIPSLPAPRTLYGDELLVKHRGDASLLQLFTRFHGTAADEHALSLRQLLGSSLDAHDDARGILFFEDICEPRGASYEAIVEEVAGCAVWAPKVELNHIPMRYSKAPPGTHEALVFRVIEVMGRDEAVGLDMLAAVSLSVMETQGARADLVKSYRDTIERLTRDMGAQFVDVYEKSLKEKVARHRAEQDAARSENGVKRWERLRAGEPLKSKVDVASLLKSPGLRGIVKKLDPGEERELYGRFGLAAPSSPRDDDKDN